MTSIALFGKNVLKYPLKKISFAVVLYCDIVSNFFNITTETNCFCVIKRDIGLAYRINYMFNLKSNKSSLNF